jgi:putative transposase
VFRSFQYRLRPTRKQEVVLDGWLHLTRELYNAALQERRDAWRKQGASITRVDQEKQLAEIRQIRPEFQQVPIVVLRGTLRRLDRGFQAFFRRCKAGEKPGFPRFKGGSWWKSILLDDLGRDVDGPKNPVLAGKRRVAVPLLGTVKLSQHRPLEGTPKAMRLTRDGRGRWFVTLACTDAPVRPLPASNAAVGVDLGLLHLATTSDGVVYENPRLLAQARIELERAQRVVTRRKRGGGRRKCAVQRLRRCHERAANVRREHQIAVAGDLVARYGTIVVEDLRIKQMVHGNLARSIYDAAWAGLLHWLHVKAESAGREVVEVNPAYTSRTCSSCGAVKDRLGLDERVFHCPACGLAIDRDVNAALNIKRFGQSPQGAATLVKVRRRSAKHESARTAPATK